MLAQIIHEQLPLAELMGVSFSGAKFSA